MIYQHSGAPALAVNPDGGRYWYHTDDKRYVLTTFEPGDPRQHPKLAHRTVTVEDEAMPVFQAFHSLHQAWMASDPDRAARIRWNTPPTVGQCDQNPTPVLDAPADVAEPEPEIAVTDTEDDASRS
jgi:hypothetical protein